MFGRIKAFVKKHWEKLVYLFFGGVTTLVNHAVYWPLYLWLEVPGFVSETVAWCVAVIAAYLTNKPFVFKSRDWALKVVAPEFLQFVGCRVISGLFQIVFIGLTVDRFQWNALAMKIIVSVVVIILNYIASKWLVFRKK